jgi:stage V sporulation protein G
MRDPIPAPTAAIGLTVLAVEPVSSGKLFALVTAEVDIEGVSVVIHGIQALRCDPAGTRIELPKFRDHTGTWRSAVTLPDEIKGPLGDAVLETLIERGLAKRRFG